MGGGEIQGSQEEQCHACVDADGSTHISRAHTLSEAKSHRKADLKEDKRRKEEMDE